MPESTSSTAAKLNPTAPSFKTLFSRTATERKGNAGKKDGGSVASASRSSLDAPSESSRLSSSLDLDAASSSDAGAPRDSLDRSSATPSETAAGAGALPRESFMRKLTRKSSAGFTTLAGRKARSAGGAGAAGVTGGGGTDDEKAEEKGRGFSFRNLRRRKGERDGEEREEE
jgi:hypothetical protein